MAKVLVVVEKGMVSEVVSDTEGVEVYVLDRDAEQVQEGGAVAELADVVCDPPRLTL